MKIKYHKNFEKQFKKLTPKSKEKVFNIIKLFQVNPNNKKLKNHKLKGKMEGKRAVLISNDLRIIFEEFDDYMLVIFFDIGTHNQVYP